MNDELKIPGVADIFGDAGIVPLPGTDTGEVCTDEGCGPVQAGDGPAPEVRYVEPEPEEAVPVDEATAQ